MNNKREIKIENSRYIIYWYLMKTEILICLGRQKIVKWKIMLWFPWNSSRTFFRNEIRRAYFYLEWIVLFLGWGLPLAAACVESQKRTSSWGWSGLACIVPSGWMPCSKQYNSQHEPPIWTPAWPMWIDRTSRWNLFLEYVLLNLVVFMWCDWSMTSLLSCGVTYHLFKISRIELNMDTSKYNYFIFK